MPLPVRPPEEPDARSHRGEEPLPRVPEPSHESKQESALPPLPSLEDERESTQQELALPALFFDPPDSEPALPVVAQSNSADTVQSPASNPSETMENFDELFEAEEEFSNEPVDHEPLEDDDWDSLLIEEPMPSEPPPVVNDSFFDELFDEELEFEQTSPAREESEPALESDVELSWDEKFLEELERDSEQEQQSTETHHEESLTALKKKPSEKAGKKSKTKPGAHRKEKTPNAFVRNLTALPLVGGAFKALFKLGALGVILLSLIPVVALLAGLYFYLLSTVPSGNSITGPDGAQASLSSLQYSDGTASGLITNSGDVVATVTTTFSLWVYNPFGGGSLFAFDEVGSCEAQEIAVDIDSESTVSTPCELSAPGLLSRVSGEINF